MIGGLSPGIVRVVIVRLLPAAVLVIGHVVFLRKAHRNSRNNGPFTSQQLMCHPTAGVAVEFQNTGMGPPLRIPAPLFLELSFAHN